METSVLRQSFPTDFRSLEKRYFYSNSYAILQSALHHKKLFSPVSIGVVMRPTSREDDTTGSRAASCIDFHITQIGDS